MKLMKTIIALMLFALLSCGPVPPPGPPCSQWDTCEDCTFTQACGWCAGACIQVWDPTTDEPVDVACGDVAIRPGECIDAVSSEASP